MSKVGNSSEDYNKSGFCEEDFEKLFSEFQEMIEQKIINEQRDIKNALKTEILGLEKKLEELQFSVEQNKTNANESLLIGEIHSRDLRHMVEFIGPVKRPWRTQKRELEVEVEVTNAVIRFLYKTHMFTFATLDGDIDQEFCFEMSLESLIGKVQGLGEYRGGVNVYLLPGRNDIFFVPKNINI